MIQQTSTVCSLLDEQSNEQSSYYDNPNVSVNQISQGESFKKNIKDAPHLLIPVDVYDQGDSCPNVNQSLVINKNELASKDTIYNKHIKAPYSFTVLQEWEGYVVAIDQETFTARLVDITNKAFKDEEEVDLPLDDLEDSDRKKISPGAVFRWVIGYNRSSGGTKDRASRIILRDMPKWTKKEIEENQLKAVEWANRLNVE